MCPAHGCTAVPQTRSSLYRGADPQDAAPQEPPAEVNCHAVILTTTSFSLKAPLPLSVLAERGDLWRVGTIVTKATQSW